MEGPCLSWRQMPTQPRALVPAPPLLRPTWRQAVSHSTGGAQWPDAFAAQGVRLTHLCGQRGRSVSIVTRHVDFDCQETPLILSGLVLVLCLDSVLGPLELCHASRKVAYACTPFSLLSLRAQLWTFSQLQENPCFSSSFLHLTEQHLLD